MKPRARRITVGAAVLVAGTVALLVVTHWGLVRDHFEVWHFQLTRETKTFNPQTLPFVKQGATPALQVLSTYSNHRVLFENSEPSWEGVVIVDLLDHWDSKETVDLLLRKLRRAGCRVLEQRFPQRAYVVMGGPFAFIAPLPEFRRTTLRERRAGRRGS